MADTKITRKSLIGEIITNYPQAVEILQEHGMHCVGCHVATWETLEQAAKSHHIDVDALVNAVSELEK